MAKKVKGIDVTAAGNKSKKTLAQGRMEYGFSKPKAKDRDVVKVNSSGVAQKHRVVAAAKIRAYKKANPNVKASDVVVKHRNNNKNDNRLSNLTVSTRSTNTADSNRARGKKKS
jgi:hypothetical protein